MAIGTLGTRARALHNAPSVARSCHLLPWRLMNDFTRSEIETFHLTDALQWVVDVTHWPCKRLLIDTQIEFWFMSLNSTSCNPCFYELIMCPDVILVVETLLSVYALMIIPNRMYAFRCLTCDSRRSRSPMSSVSRPSSEYVPGRYIPPPCPAVQSLETLNSPCRAPRGCLSACERPSRRSGPHLVATAS